MKVLCVVGARPNFVKIAPLVTEMRHQPGIRTVLIHTGQHYDAEMSADIFRDLGIPRPDVDLGVGAASPASQTAEIIKCLEPIMTSQRPDVVLVVGDVNSTLAGTLTAVKLGIPVAHLEAGLRSFDRRMPEEINRVLTDAASDLLFVSEPSGVENLVTEGHPPERIFLVGNVMIDTLRGFLDVARSSNAVQNLGLTENHGSGGFVKYAVVTLHRPSTVDNSQVFLKVWGALLEIARKIRVVFPVHPRTRRRLQEIGVKDFSPVNPSGISDNMQIVPPLSYLQFLHLQSEATLVITDSGGIQEETTALGVPCLTVRENTERPITVTEGTNTIVGLDPQRIQEEVAKVLANRAKKGRVPKLWDGHCAERVVKILHDHWLGVSPNQLQLTHLPPHPLPRP